MYRRQGILESAKEHRLRNLLPCISAMTTTMQNAGDHGSRKKEEDITAKIIISGAVITGICPDGSGADGYSRMRRMP